MCHSLLEGGTANENFTSVLRAALVTLSETVTDNMDPYNNPMLATSKPCGYLQFGNPRNRWVGKASNAELGAEGPDQHGVAQFIQRSEQALMDRFPINTRGVRAFIRELPAYQCKHTLLLAELTFERLYQVSNPEFFPRALYSPFLETQDIYMRLWQTIPVQLRGLAHRIFAWLLWAHRPLLIDELCAAMHFYWNLPIAPVHPSGAESSALTDLEYSITDVCGGLAYVADDRTVRFIHYDIKRFLISNPCTSNGLRFSPDYQEAQELLALTCLDTLTWQAHRQVEGSKMPLLAETYMSLGGLRLTKYADINWAGHCRLAESKSHYVTGAILEYLQYSCFHRSCTETKVDNIAMVSISARNAILHKCALLGFVELGRTLLEMGAELNSKDALMQSTPLSKALGRGHWNIAALLIEEGAISDEHVKGTGSLHQASACGRIDIIALLIQHGADPNATTETAETPLHWAVMSDRPEVVRDLLYAGADANRATELTRETPLHFAAQLGCERAVRSLLESADVMAMSSENWTALHYAAAYGHTPIVEALIKHGADMDAKTLCRRTALMLANEYGHSSVASLLLSYSFEEAWPFRTNSSASSSSRRANSGIHERDDLRILFRPDNTDGYSYGSNFEQEYCSDSPKAGEDR